MDLTPSIDTRNDVVSGGVLASPDWTSPLGALGYYARVYQQLCKARLTGLVALTASFGYLMESGRPGYGALSSFLGVFLMACGGAALNQLQEKNFDAKMLRTQRRPLVTGELSSASAALAGILLLALGTALLYYAVSPLAALLGAIAIFWYNGVYTYLKRATALAVIPGAVIGAIPPMIGWVAAGGFLTDPMLGMTALFFLIWQVPHFWLLLMLYGKDYERGGFPSLTERFSLLQLKRYTLAWIVLLALEACLIPLLGSAQRPVYTTLGLMLASLWMIAGSLRIFAPTPAPAGANEPPVAALRRTFHSINVYMVLVMLLLCFDRI